MLDKIYTAIRSRTVWTIVLMFIVNGVAGVHNMIPPEAVTYADLFLSACAIYFRVTPRV